MPRLAFRQRILALILVTVLAAPWVAAAAPAAARRQPASPSVFGQIWNAFASFLGSMVVPDAGCWIDPNGRCAPGVVVPPDAGCMPDPNGGRCAAGATVSPDAGCRLDPNGLCAPSS